MKLIHKRALSLLLSTALVLTTLPVAAMAATEPGVSYLDSDNNEAQAEATVIDSGSTTLDSGWYVVDSDNLTFNQTLTVSGDANLILADGASLTVNGSSGDNAGISVPQGSSLSIYAQSNGSDMGELTATGSGNGAGIGSNSSSPSGNITICGGRITATGGSGDLCAAGIGNVSTTGFGTICIYGGMVTATNGFGGSYPDIGGCSGNGDEILIKGGTVVSGRSDSSVNLGVNAHSYMGTFPEVVIDGGSIPRGLIGSSSLTDGHEPLISSSPDVLTVPGQENAVVASISIDGVTYGNSTYTDGSGKLYLNLPAYNSVLPVVVTMEDGSKYWATYEPGFGEDITLVNAEESPIFPGKATFCTFSPENLTAYKLDPDQTFSGILNGETPLVEGQDYTADGDNITIKKEYLAKLPIGETTLTFSGLGDGGAALPVTVLGSGEYMALGDSIAAGYGLEGYDPEADTLPASAYASIVGNTLGLTTGFLASNGMNSASLISILSNPDYQAYLSKAKVLTLSIGSDDVLLPFLGIVAQKLNCNPEDIQSTLTALAQSDQAALAADLTALNADDGTGIKNNQILTAAASGFAQNFKDIISALKTALPSAKIYVTNAYNPYEGISIPYGAGTLNLGDIAESYITTLNQAFSSDSSEYTLIDVHKAFSDSLKSGTSLVNANLAILNFDPHPNLDGHAKIAHMILAAYNGATSQKPVIQTTSLPEGTEYTQYSQTLEATGSAPITWSIASGALPDGLTLNPDSGEISGTGKSWGTFNFTVKASNAMGTDTRSLSITIEGVALSGVISRIIQLSPNSPASTVSGVAADVLCLPPSDQAALTGPQVATLEGLMQTTLHIPAPTISAPVTTDFIGSAALPKTPPSVSGLLLNSVAYDSNYWELKYFVPEAAIVTLSTTQQSTACGPSGTQVAFDLTLTEKLGNDPPQTIHAKLPFPVTVTMPLPANFILQPNCTYVVAHNKADGNRETLPLKIGGTFGNYTATFTTSSFSSFSIVGTLNGSSSDSHHSSDGSVSNPSVTENPAEVTFVSDTNADFSVNGAYQFRITSKNGTVPSLTVGTPGVFETQLVRVSGNDYYFQLTSVGKAGEKAGIYVNGVKLLAATVGTAADPVKSDTTAFFQVAKGKTYIFKLTADEKPSFVCGNSSVFLVKFLRQSGKDYYYQVTATGKPGQTAGFYINAAQKPVAAAAVA